GQLKPLQSAVEQRNVRHLDVLGQRFGLNVEPMVLAGDEYTPGLDVLHGMVGSMMARLHLDGTPGQPKAKNLLAQADAEQRNATIKRNLRRFNGVKAGLGVSGDRKSV